MTETKQEQQAKVIAAQGRELDRLRDENCALRGRVRELEARGKVLERDLHCMTIDRDMWTGEVTRLRTGLEEISNIPCRSCGGSLLARQLIGA